MGFPKFPKYDEPWLECPICGECHPRHVMVRHYKKGFWVDPKCADDLTHDDYMAQLQRGRERPEPSEQPCGDMEGAMPSPCFMTVSPTSLTYPIEGANQLITVQIPSACEWTATAGCDWITISSGSSGQGSGTIHVDVPRNMVPSDSPRTCTITITPPRGTPTTVTVTQSSPPMPTGGMLFGTNELFTVPTVGQDKYFGITTGLRETSATSASGDACVGSNFPACTIVSAVGIANQVSPSFTSSVYALYVNDVVTSMTLTLTTLYQPVQAIGGPINVPEGASVHWRLVSQTPSSVVGLWVTISVGYQLASNSRLLLQMANQGFADAAAVNHFGGITFQSLPFSGFLLGATETGQYISMIPIDVTATKMYYRNLRIGSVADYAGSNSFTSELRNNFAGTAFSVGPLAAGGTATATGSIALPGVTEGNAGNAGVLDYRFTGIKGAGGLAAVGGSNMLVYTPSVANRCFSVSALKTGDYLFAPGDFQHIGLNGAGIDFSPSFPSLTTDAATPIPLKCTLRGVVAVAAGGLCPGVYTIKLQKTGAVTTDVATLTTDASHQTFSDNSLAVAFTPTDYANWYVQYNSGGLNANFVLLAIWES